MFGNRLERNLNYLNKTPEGKQALEDAIVAWEDEKGELPNQTELDTITTYLVRQRHPVIRTVSNILFVIILLIIAASCAERCNSVCNGTYKERTFYYY